MVGRRMTDKEMAEEYVHNHVHYEVVKRENGTEYAKEVSSVTIKQAYSDGLKDGRPKWHDLRKDPNDLPKRDERFNTKVNVPVFSSKGNFVVYYFEAKEWYRNGQKEEVIAWCEIPKFEEE